MATWAKGLDFKNASNTTRIGGVGVYGTDTTAQKIYIGLGTEPWNNAGLQLTNSAINFKGNKIYHAGDKPTLGELGAAASNHTHSSLSGNATTATTLQTARTINGTSFNGSANITTAKWGTARTLTLTGGATGSVSIDGSANVSLATTVNWANVSGKPSSLPANGGNSDTVDNLHANAFARAHSGGYHFGGNQNAITTAQFIELIKAQGAFNQPVWISRGSWSYANNQYINDTGCGNIHLAGCTIEVIGTSSTHTIRIHTPTTSSSGVTNGEFIYVNNGTDYSPGWRRLYSTKYKPGASDIGALSLNGGTVTGKTIFGGFSSTTWENSQLEINSGGAGTARLVFHRPGQSQMSIIHDAKDTLKAVLNNGDAHTIWHSGNFDPNSKVSSETLKTTWSWNDLNWRLGNHHGFCSFDTNESSGASPFYAYGAGISFGGPNCTAQFYVPEPAAAGRHLYFRGQWANKTANNTWNEIWHSGNFNPDSKLDTANATIGGDGIYNNGWYRCNGNNGVYFQQHGGGWHMEDSTWIRAYGGKSIYTPSTIRCDGESQATSFRLHGVHGDPVFKSGGGDAAHFGVQNIRLNCWYGFGIEAYDGKARTVFNARQGDIGTTGNVYTQDAHGEGLVGGFESNRGTARSRIAAANGHNGSIRFEGIDNNNGNIIVHYVMDSGAFYGNGNNRFGVGYSDYRFTEVWCTRGAFNGSDSKLKENIKAIKRIETRQTSNEPTSIDFYNYVKKTGVYSFNYKNTSENFVGILADEIPTNIFNKIGTMSKTQEEYEKEIIEKDKLNMILNRRDLSSMKDNQIVEGTDLTYSELKNEINKTIEEPVRLINAPAQMAMLQEVLSMAINKIDVLENEIRILKDKNGVI